jgi:hypothetical protein
MQNVDSETRSRYLALALDARKILDSLVRFVELGERTIALDTFVKKAIQSLDSVTQRGIASAVHSDLAFAQYEQVLTLDEIGNEEERKAVIDDLKRIIESEHSDEQKDAAVRVLEFFFALESRALQYYYRPPVVSVSLA